MDTEPTRGRYRTAIGAASLIVAPAFMSVGDLMHPHESWDAAAQVAMIAQSASRWYVAHLLLFVGMLLFVPGILALIYAGYGYAAESWLIREHSTVTAEGPPVYHFKSVIPVAGALVMIQGLAEIARCVLCLRTGAWPARLEDVEEIDVVGEQLARSEFVDEESRRAAAASAHSLEEAARQRTVIDETERQQK